MARGRSRRSLGVILGLPRGFGEALLGALCALRGRPGGGPVNWGAPWVLRRRPGRVSGATFGRFLSILGRFSEVRALLSVTFFATFSKNGKVAFVWPWPHETRVGTFKKRPTIDEKAIEKRKGNFFGVKTLPARVFFAKVGPGAPEIDPKSTKICPKVAPGGPRAPARDRKAKSNGQRATCNGHRARPNWSKTLLVVPPFPPRLPGPVPVY